MLFNKSMNACAIMCNVIFNNRLLLSNHMLEDLRLKVICSNNTEEHYLLNLHQCNYDTFCIHQKQCDQCDWDGMLLLPLYFFFGLLLDFQSVREEQEEYETQQDFKKQEIKQVKAHHLSILSRGMFPRHHSETNFHQYPAK